MMAVRSIIAHPSDDGVRLHHRQRVVVGDLVVAAKVSCPSVSGTLTVVGRIHVAAVVKFGVDLHVVNAFFGPDSALLRRPGLFFDEG